MTQSLGKPIGDPASRPQLAVSAVIFRDGKVLLVRRARSPGKGFYSLPGGRVEYGESLHTALAREVDEETGLKIEILGLAGWLSVAGLCLALYALRKGGRGAKQKAAQSPEAAGLAGSHSEQVLRSP